MKPRRTRLADQLALLTVVAMVVTSLGGCYTGTSNETDAGSDDAGTGDDGGPGECPDDLPSACPTEVPSYPNDVVPVVTARCTSCHSPGGVEPNHDFTSYAGVYAERAKILSQVYTCRMPPPPAQLLTAAERQAVLAWLVCGAPNQ